MRYFLCLVFIYFSFSYQLYASGENCSSPVVVSAGCPAITMSNQSTAGMINDIASWKYSSYSSFFLNGEDMVYALTFPSGTTELIVSLHNMNKSAYLFTSASCATSAATQYPYRSLSTGNNSNLSLAVPATGSVLYLHVDHSGSNALTFDISFGAVMKGTLINIADTRGKLEFVTSNCVNPSFMTPLDLSVDGVKQSNPAYFGSNNSSHEYCMKFFIQNLTGKEAVKSFSFTFAPQGFTGVSVSASSFPGRYSNGTWHAVVAGNTVTWTYANAEDPYKGDYDDVTKNCLEYTFCINASPINNANFQLINIWVTGDGKTPGYNSYQYTGCCATNNCALYGAEGYRGLGGTAFGGPAAGAAGFGMGIGNAGLPLDLLNVWMEKTTLHWKTANETQLSHHMIQYSLDGESFTDLKRIASLGNNKSGLNAYESDLTNDISGACYLRIKSVDEDGTEHFSKIINSLLSSHSSLEMRLSPNPVNGLLHIELSESIQNISIYSIDGTIIYQRNIPAHEQVKDLFYDFEKEAKGIYTVQVTAINGVLQKQVIKH